VVIGVTAVIGASLNNNPERMRRSSALSRDIFRISFLKFTVDAEHAQQNTDAQAKRDAYVDN
jgi:hypothetical protein